MKITFPYRTSKLLTQVDAPIVADVETYGTDPRNGKLLGVALCSILATDKPVYVALQWYDFATSSWHIAADYDDKIDWLRALFTQCTYFVGHNYAYDKSWIDHLLGMDTKWTACTRLMWHMASAPSGPRPYGLKDAQVELLGYAAKGNEEMNWQIKARGGKPGADIYLADLEVCGRYAMLDATSTAQLYLKLAPFFDEHDYWWMLEKMVEYSWLLQVCTASGIRVNMAALEEQAQILLDTRLAYESHLIQILEPHINRLERIWREDRAARYAPQASAAKERFLSNLDMQKKFKLSSDKDKQELFYTSMKLPVIMETDGGKPSTAFDAIKLAVMADPTEELLYILECYRQYEQSEMLLNSFVKPWLGCVEQGRLHPRFNPCGTVSYRLSGFKPYLLNAPFDEHAVMSCFTCDEGWEGVHADFASVEPCVTAHYSQDPNLLKVFGQGLGDVYLDLATTLFRDDVELNSYYDSQAPITSEIKERFKKQRTVAKVIQLAVQYTGTKYTVRKNLSYAGINVSLDEAGAMVDAYWKHFHRVAVMNEALFLKFNRQGYLRNVVGRVIRVPTFVPIKKRDGTIWEKPIPRYKDLPNRFIQSSAHDLLSFYVLRIASLIRDRGITAKPVILDCHDSTTWQAPKGQVAALEQVFVDALRELNEEVRMTVDVRIEKKRFTTLAGLKGDE